MTSAVAREVCAKRLCSRQDHLEEMGMQDLCERLLSQLFWQWPLLVGFHTTWGIYMATLATTKKDRIIFPRWHRWCFVQFFYLFGPSNSGMAWVHQCMQAKLEFLIFEWRWMQLLCQPSAKGPEKHGFLFSSKHFSLLGRKNIGRISKSFAVVSFW